MSWTQWQWVVIVLILVLIDACHYVTTLHCMHWCAVLRTSTISRTPPSDRYRLTLSMLARLSTATLFFSGQENYKIWGHFQDIKPCFQAKICLTVLRKCYKNTAAATNKLFKCDILFTFHSNCIIEAQVRQAHMGRGVHSLKHAPLTNSWQQVLMYVGA